MKSVFGKISSQQEGEIMIQKITTEKVKIENSGSGMPEALSMTEQAAGLLHLSAKNKLRTRLLAEEALSMVRTVTGEFSADFWIELEGKTLTLNLEAKSELNYPKRQELLSVSTSGKNTANLGIMEKIRGIIEAGIYGMAESYSIQAEYGGGMLPYGAIGLPDDGMADALYAWSMQKYKDEIGEINSEKDDSYGQQLADELEKSIIANIADDVRVGVRKDGVKLVIVKNFQEEQ